MPDIYDTIKRLIKERGVPLSVLSQKSGVPLQVLRDLDSGELQTVTLDTAKKIADALNVSVQELVKGEWRYKGPLATCVPASENEELINYLESLRTQAGDRILFSLTDSATQQDVEDAVRIVDEYLRHGNV